jgi:hypothetical protein
MSHYLPYITQEEPNGQNLNFLPSPNNYQQSPYNFQRPQSPSNFQRPNSPNNFQRPNSPNNFHRPQSPSNFQRSNSPTEGSKIILKRQNVQKGAENIYIWMGINIETEEDLKNLIQTIVSGKPYVYMFCISYYCTNQEYISILQNILSGTKFILTKNKTVLSLDQHMNKLWECFSFHSGIRTIKKWDIVVFCEPKDIILPYINEYKNNKIFIGQIVMCLIRKEYESFNPDTIINMIAKTETDANTEIEFYASKCFSGTSLRIHFLDNYFKIFKEFKTGLFLKHIQLTNCDGIDPFIFHYTS